MIYFCARRRNNCVSFLVKNWFGAIFTSADGHDIMADSRVVDRNMTRVDKLKKVLSAIAFDGMSNELANCDTWVLAQVSGTANSTMSVSLNVSI